MKELNQVVSNKFSQMSEDGTIEKMVQEQAEALVARVIKDAFREYGDFGEAIKEKVKESLQGALNNVTLPEYNKFINDTLTQAYSNALNEYSAAQFKSVVEKTLEPAPKEMTAEALLEGIKEVGLSWCDWNDLEEVEVMWEGGDSRIEIIINDDTRVTFYDFDHSGKYHIGYLANGRRVYSGPVADSTHTFGAEAYLYKLYCAQTQITDFNAVYGGDISLRDY